MKKINTNYIINFILIYLGYMLLFVDRTTINLVLASIGKDFHLSTTALGLASSAFFLGYTLMQMPGGYLTDKFGSRNVFLFVILGWSILSGLMGFIWSFASLIAIRFLLGIVEGPYLSAALKEVSEDFPTEKKSQTTTLLLSSNFLASALTPVFIVGVIASIGWRHTFSWISLAGILLLIIFLLLNKKQFTTKKAIKKPKIDWSHINNRIWIFVIIGFFLSLIIKGLGTWMPIYFLTERHLNLKSLAWLVPLPAISGGIAAMLSGFIMIHLFKKHERLMLVTFSILTAIFMFGLYKSTSLFWIVFFEVLTYFTKSLAFTGIYAFAARIFDSKTYGSSIGVISFGSQLGSFCGPILIGWLINITGSYSAAFLGLVIAALLAALTSLFAGNIQYDAQQTKEEALL